MLTNTLQPEEILGEWKSWNSELLNQPALLSKLGKGLTNQSYLLKSDLGKLVLRINNSNSENLGINRQREALILGQLNRTAGVKIGPQIVHQNPNHQYLIYQFIEGKVWTKIDALKPDNQKHLKQIIDRYQKIHLPIAPRNYKNYLLDYWQQLNPKGLIDDKTQEQFLVFTSKLEQQNWSPKLSHHDLTAENIIETPEGLRIIDWEYAHLGHPGLDWASISNDKNTLASELLHWMNLLWTLLANAR